MYERISYLIGERRMEVLNEKLCEAFVFGPAMMAVTKFKTIISVHAGGTAQ